MSVVRVVSWPSQSAITVVSTPPCSSRMALVWRGTCGEIGLLLSVGQRCAATAACLVSSRSTESRLSRPPWLARNS
jgi:hypothetical protein